METSRIEIAEISYLYDYSDAHFQVEHHRHSNITELWPESLGEYNHYL